MKNIRNDFIIESNQKALSIEYLKIDPEKADIGEEFTVEQNLRLKITSINSDLESIDDRKTILTEKIIKVVLDLVHHGEDIPKIKNSDYIKSQLNHDYKYLSNVFSEKMGSTIENYIITQKIERVKELLLFDELNITQISYILNYSSVAHLSTQFKKMTGFTPSSYKQLKKYA